MKTSIFCLSALTILLGSALSLSGCNKSSPSNNTPAAPAVKPTPGAGKDSNGNPLPGQPHFSKVFIVMLEKAKESKASKQPYLSELKKKGAYLANFHGISNSTLPNYIALTSGDINGVKGDALVDLKVENIADLLEGKGLTWKSYVEDYPGNCFLGKNTENYERKRSPFLSYSSITTVPKRCDNIVSGLQLQKDFADGKLPHFSLYVPNTKNNGRGSDVATASKWLETEFGKLLEDPAFLKDTLVVITYDESGDILGIGSNHIYTLLLGEGIEPGYVDNTRYNTYSLLRTIEDNLGLGTLRKKDESATPIDGVWKK